MAHTVEVLRWAKKLIEDRTGGRQWLAAGWDGMPAIRMEDTCMVGLHFSLLKNKQTGIYDCQVKGYIRTCGGYNKSARMKELVRECEQVADIVLTLEEADIHASEEEVQVFCEELKGLGEAEQERKLCGSGPQDGRRFGRNGENGL